MPCDPKSSGAGPAAPFLVSFLSYFQGKGVKIGSPTGDGHTHSQKLKIAENQEEEAPMKRLFCKGIIWYLTVAMFVIGVTPRVYAGFAPSEGLAFTSEDRNADMGKIQKFLEMKMVRERLKDLGFTLEEVQGKLKDFSDQQLHQMAMSLDELKVAGDGAGIVVGLIIIALLVVAIIYLSGHRVVVK
jgi:hypothetical protein